MTFARDALIDDPEKIPRMPSWVTAARVETIEDVAFLSGAALSHLHLVFARDDIPHALFRDRLALRAAEACVGFSGRSERAGELRDALHLLRPGDLPGPAGETYLAWRRAVERPASIKALCRALPELQAERIADWLYVGQGARMARVASVLEAVLNEAPRTEAPALILADATMAQALGWDHVVPLLAGGLKRADLRKRGDDLRLACHRAVVTSAIEAGRHFSAPDELSRHINDMNLRLFLGHIKGSKHGHRGISFKVSIPAACTIHPISAAAITLCVHHRPEPRCPA